MRFPAWSGPECGGVRVRVRRSKQNAQAKSYGIIMAFGDTDQPLGFLEKRECRRRSVAAEGARLLDVPSWAEWKGVRQAMTIDH